LDFLCDGTCGKDRSKRRFIAGVKMLLQMFRIIIIVEQVGAPKIYVAAVDALRKNERWDETHFATKVDGFWSFTSR